ncbi:hypothetical protein Runsl_0077 [Runella slithyformis DSM 19594]|uniref:Uncharacterized protein n=1 Tax=Runella slithyformis (strain ATCC 29530 / DSM 19594 / LMG 11500 / NCIMB 11436 / LSU 4) TaxID=761193 RepID=A0A7U3ZG08_RUNSL|nr:hypothetical protein Runsl_0077 [Runella slithyformis DSM 19594]
MWCIKWLGIFKRCFWFLKPERNEALGFEKPNGKPSQALGSQTRKKSEKADKASPFFVVGDMEIAVNFLLHFFHVRDHPHDPVLFAQGF